MPEKKTDFSDLLIKHRGSPNPQRRDNVCKVFGIYKVFLRQYDECLRWVWSVHSLNYTAYILGNTIKGLGIISNVFVVRVCIYLR